MNTVSIETKRAAILRLQQVPGFEPGSSPSRALPVVCYCLLESTQHNELADVKSICRQACENRRRVVVCPNLSTPERIILQNGLSSISFHVSALSSGSSRLHRFPQRCRARLSQTSVRLVEEPSVSSFKYLLAVVVPQNWGPWQMRFLLRCSN